MTRSGSNQTSVRTFFAWAWSLTARKPLGNRLVSGSHVPTFHQPSRNGYQPASIHQKLSWTPWSTYPSMNCFWLVSFAFCISFIQPELPPASNGGGSLPSRRGML